MRAIDLNSDLGENTQDRIVGDDDAMLDLVTSANVAAGFHAGDPAGIRQTLVAAAARGVVVGAHPGYRDFENFGRIDVEITPPVLQAEVEYQLGAVMSLATSAGTRVRYVKPHGALYNAIVHDEVKARAVVAAVRAVDDSLVLLGLAGAVVLDVAEAAGLSVAREAFADRAYHADGSLVSRRVEGAVLHDPVLVAERMHRLVADGTLTSIEGEPVTLRADSICVHGDSRGAIGMAADVRARLESEGVELRAFVRDGA